MTGTVEFEVRPNERRVPAGQRAALLADPWFGRVFTDHMVTLRYTAADGWHAGRVEACAPIPFHPAASVFHYGQEIFEGLKAYRQSGGSVALFRPERNAARFNRSVGWPCRSCPRRPSSGPWNSASVPGSAAADTLLAGQDQDWVPETARTSLYLRPLMIATQCRLGFTLPSDSPPVSTARPVPQPRIPPGVAPVNPFDDPEGSFSVLVNDEDQHSLWLAVLPVPAGWQVAHGPDARAACLEFVEANWSDIRPRSTRRGPGSAAG